MPFLVLRKCNAWPWQSICVMMRRLFSFPKGFSFSQTGLIGSLTFSVAFSSIPSVGGIRSVEGMSTTEDVVMSIDFGCPSSVMASCVVSSTSSMTANFFSSGRFYWIVLLCWSTTAFRSFLPFWAVVPIVIVHHVSSLWWLRNFLVSVNAYDFCRCIAWKLCWVPARFSYPMLVSLDVCIVLCLLTYLS